MLFRSKNTYSGPDSGVGAVCAWDGNSDIGAGSATIIDSKPGELVRMRMDWIRPMAGVATVEFTFKPEGDKTTVIYNHRITLKGIPDAAWDYVVNGKAALDWVMERQAVRTDKVSGIVNDANDWATETMGNPKYPLELFQRVVTVSLETQKIVNSLPALDI